LPYSEGRTSASPFFNLTLYSKKDFQSGLISFVLRIAGWSRESFMHDERALRRPGFRPGIKIRLADGHFWSLPVPTEHVVEMVDDPTAVDSPWNEPSYQSIIHAILEAQDASELFRAEMALAIHLLNWNYALSPDDFEELLDDINETRRAVLRDALHSSASAHLKAVISDGETLLRIPTRSWQDEVRRSISQAVSWILGRRGPGKVGADRPS